MLPAVVRIPAPVAIDVKLPIAVTAPPRAIAAVPEFRVSVSAPEPAIVLAKVSAAFVLLSVVLTPSTTAPPKLCVPTVKSVPAPVANFVAVASRLVSGVVPPIAPLKVVVPAPVSFRANAPLTAPICVPPVDVNMLAPIKVTAADPKAMLPPVKLPCSWTALAPRLIAAVPVLIAPVAPKVTREAKPVLAKFFTVKSPFVVEIVLLMKALSARTRIPKVDPVIATALVKVTAFTAAKVTLEVAALIVAGAIVMAPAVSRVSAAAVNVATPAVATLMSNGSSNQSPVRPLAARVSTFASRPTTRTDFPDVSTKPPSPANAPPRAAICPLKRVV